MRATDAVDRHLARLVDAGASRSLHRQRRWALRHALTAAALAAVHGPPPLPDDVAATAPDALDAAERRVDVAELLSPAFLDWYLPWAADGGLTDPARPTAGRSPAAARARVAALRALAADVGLPPPDHTHGTPQLRTVIERRPVEDLLRAFEGHRPRPTATRARLLAMLAVMAADPVGPTALAAMDVRDLAVDTRTLRAPSDGRPLTLSPAAAAALGTWLGVRDELVASLEGGAVRAMWVSAHGLRDADGTARPPGLPLRTRGIERAYARGVRALRRHLAAHPERVPHSLLPEHTPPGTVPPLDLPPSLELLRRSLLAAGHGPEHAPAAPTATPSAQSR
ncbi:hypothetical protein GXP71_06190 [Cellulomonas sp. H30R-01]|uniref:hypothetical protein n=1 Tax=Cellulomonas sp. H30R-01 TaxID=2704467 RepID=UPI00138C6213|nr:hypothetical protein [Cellulomonas sp. H30R-01]QHT55711.1 hypothetical protein GXP71_06190 [Cellulomonas sp. H30R-01]